MQSPPTVWITKCQSSSCSHWITSLQMWTGLHLRDGPSWATQPTMRSGRWENLSCFWTSKGSWDTTDSQTCWIGSSVLCWMSCTMIVPGLTFTQCRAWRDPSLLCPFHCRSKQALLHTANGTSMGPSLSSTLRGIDEVWISPIPHFQSHALYVLVTKKRLELLPYILVKILF